MWVVRQARSVGDFRYFDCIGQPGSAADVLATATMSAARSGALRDRLLEIGYVPVGSTPAEFRARIDDEIAKWTRIIQAANIKPG